MSGILFWFHLERDGETEVYLHTRFTYRWHPLFMFSLEVTAGFNRLWVCLCLTNWIVQHAQSHGGSFEDFPWPQRWSERVCVCACACVWVYVQIVNRNELKSCIPSALTTLGLKLKQCDTRMWLTPPTLLHLVIFYHEWAYECRISRIQPRFNLHTRARPHKHSHSNLGASSRALIYRRPTFCLARTGNSGLRGGGGLEKQGEEKNEQSMGMGLKENIAQTPDVGTPCARTPVCLQRHTVETGW